MLAKPFMAYLKPQKSLQFLFYSKGASSLLSADNEEPKSEKFFHIKEYPYYRASIHDYQSSPQHLEY